MDTTSSVGLFEKDTGGVVAVVVVLGEAATLG
jgi:hypothetical protein